MKMNKLTLAVALSLGMASCSPSFAGFGQTATAKTGGKIGITRSIPTAPKQTYINSGNFRGNGSTASSTSDYRGSTNHQPVQQSNPSTLKQIATTAAGVGGGILAAEAIKSLVTGGSEQHTTVVQQAAFPQTIPQSVPVQQHTESAVGTVNTVSQAPMQYLQKAESGFQFWDSIGEFVKILIFVGIVGGVIFVIYRVFRKVNNGVFINEGEKVINLKEDFEDKLFYLFASVQHNANNKQFLKENTRYIDIDSVLDEHSYTTLAFNANTVEISRKNSKVEAICDFDCKVRENKAGSIPESVNQRWFFEYDGKWYLTGVEEI